MSKMVDGTPISMWLNSDITEAVDRIVCAGGVSREVMILAEAIARIYARLGADNPEFAKETL